VSVSDGLSPIPLDQTVRAPNRPLPFGPSAKNYHSTPHNGVSDLICSVKEMNPMKTSPPQSATAPATTPHRVRCAPRPRPVQKKNTVKLWNCEKSGASPAPSILAPGTVSQSHRFCGAKMRHHLCRIVPSSSTERWPKSPFAEASAAGGSRNGSTEMRS